MSKDTDKKQKRKLKGVVTSDKMEKTRVVQVSRIKQHRKYLKHYNVSQKFKAHDEKNEYKVGDKVIIEEMRPMSRDKRWKIIGKVETKK